MRERPKINIPYNPITKKENVATRPRLTSHHARRDMSEVEGHLRSLQGPEKKPSLLALSIALLACSLCLAHTHIHIHHACLVDPVILVGHVRCEWHWIHQKTQPMELSSKNPNWCISRPVLVVMDHVSTQLQFFSSHLFDHCVDGKRCVHIVVHVVIFR